MSNISAATLSQVPPAVRPQAPTIASSPAGPALGSLGADTFVTSSAAPPAPKESLMLRAEEEVADVIDFFAKIPLLRDLGYQIYGAVTKPKASTPPLSNLGQIAPNLVRGAQPTERGFQQLKQQGVKTVINLRPEEQWEAPMVRAAGMKYVYMPLPAIGAPSNQQALDFLSAVTDPANGKVFFHCQHGADRTGAMAAAYRIAVDGWTTDRAIAEMPQYGFHQGIEDEKLTFVRQFASYWNSLPAATRAQVLHQTAALGA